MDYERRQVYRGPEAYVDLPADRGADRYPHRRGAGRSPRQRRPAGRRGARSLAAQGGRGAAVGRDDHRHRRRAATGDLGPGAQGRRRRSRSAAARWCARCADAKGEWTLTQLPEVEGALRGARPTHRRRSARWSAASTSTRASSTTSPRPGASRARASSRSSTRRRWKRASRRRRWSTTRRCSSMPAATGSQPWEPKNYDGKFEGPMPLQHGAGQVEEHGLDPHPAGHRPELRAGLDHALRLRRRASTRPT